MKAPYPLSLQLPTFIILRNLVSSLFSLWVSSNRAPLAYCMCDGFVLSGHLTHLYSILQILCILHYTCVPSLQKIASKLVKEFFWQETKSLPASNLSFFSNFSSASMLKTVFFYMQCPSNQAELRISILYVSDAYM